MMYEQLVNEGYQHQVQIYERVMSPRLKGLYADDIVWINKIIPTNTEKACVLAEELGHHHTSAGDILDQSSIMNRKQELRARRWAYNRLIPLHRIIQAQQNDITNRYELADYLNVTEEFLEEALEWYKSKYGLTVTIRQLTICFEPLGVLEMFDFIETPIRYISY